MTDADANAKGVVISYERFRERREKRQQIAAARTRTIGEEIIDGEVLDAEPSRPIDTAAPPPPQPPRADKEHAPKG